MTRAAPPADTIVAAATPPGRGGVAVVRVSGPLVPAMLPALLGAAPAARVAASPRLAMNASFRAADGGVLDNGQLCYIINAAGLANPTAAVIRSGKKSDNGAVVMNLRAPVGGSVGDCTPVAPDLARKLVKDAHNYWFEIDSAQYPQGAAGAWLMGQNG